MFGLYLLVGGLITGVGEGLTNAYFGGNYILTCLLRALARKPFGDQNEENHVCRPLHGHTRSCLSNKLCLEASVSHVANWTDVQGIASPKKCAWGRHFVTLPTCPSLTFGGRWEVSNVNSVSLAARSATLSCGRG